MKRFAVIVAALCISTASHAQQPEDLKQLARDAGIVFSGTVISVHAEQGDAGDVGIVRVSFRVIDALRGAAAGQILTISEWAGLWTARDRYRVGETVILFLYPPSDVLGLTTTVNGQGGHVSLGEVTLPLSSLLSDSPADPVAPAEEKPHHPSRPPLRMEPAY